MRKPSGSLKNQAYDKKTINRKILQQLKERYIISNAKESILQLLFYDPLEEFALSEIVSYAQVSKSTASRIIRELEEGGYVSLIRRPLIWRIRANYENPAFKREKILDLLQN